jgi:hypothetical protein
MTRYCALCGCQRPKTKGWFVRIIDGIKTWVCPQHKDPLA